MIAKGHLEGKQSYVAGKIQDRANGRRFIARLSREPGCREDQGKPSGQGKMEIGKKSFKRKMPTKTEEKKKGWETARGDMIEIGLDPKCESFVPGDENNRNPKGRKSSEWGIIVGRSIKRGGRAKGGETARRVRRSCTCSWQQSLRNREERGMVKGKKVGPEAAV